MMKQENKKIKILLVRFQRIGDAILASPLCNSLKKSFPNSQIDYVLYEPATPLFLHHPYIDKVICISKKEQKNIFAYVRRVWEITREKYDIIIDVMSTPKSELFTLFSLGSEFRIGRYKKNRGFTYTHRQKEPENTKNKIDKFLKQLLSPLSEKYTITYDSSLVLSLYESEKKDMKEKMLDAGINFSKPIACFSTISRVERKNYPLDFMKEVIKYCLNHYDMQLVFFYSPDQYNQIKEIADTFVSHSKYKNIFTNIKTKDMRELMALLSQSDCYLGNQGGGRHLAQSLNIPNFSINHPGSDTKEWIPWPSDTNIGLEPLHTLNFHNISIDEYHSLSYEEKFHLLTPDFVIRKMDIFLSKVFQNTSHL